VERSRLNVLTKRNITVAVICLTGGLVATGVGLAVLRGAGTPSSQPAYTSSASRHMVLATLPATAGRPTRWIVLQRTPDGYVCLWDAPGESGAQGLGGCNPASDPLGGRKLFVNLTYDGGPKAETVRDARLSGLFTTDVASADVIMSDGSSRRILLLPVDTRSIAGADYRAFGFRLRESDLRDGVTPVAVVVRDATGAEIDRQATGIG
jgi:hypothetical protein